MDWDRDGYDCRSAWKDGWPHENTYVTKTRLYQSNVCRTRARHSIGRMLTYSLLPPNARSQLQLPSGRKTLTFIRLSQGQYLIV